MAKAETKVPVTTEEKPATPAAAAMQAWRPFESLRREVDRLFEDFTLNPFRLPLRRPAFDLEPFWQPEFLGRHAGDGPRRAARGFRDDGRAAGARREEH